MSSALDEVLENKEAQEFWLRRLIAVAIDAFIIFIPISVITAYALAIGFDNQGSWLLSGTLLVAYTALFESELGYTIGKRVMNLEVVSLDPRPYDMKRALVRNITKLHPVLLFLDLLVGLLGEDRTNMRYLDIMGNTEVVDTQVAEWRRTHGLAPPPAGAEPGRPVTVQTGGPPPEPAEPPRPPEVEVEPAPPEPPVEDDALQEVPAEPEAGEEDLGAPGIPPPPVPPKPYPPEVVKAAEEGGEGEEDGEGEETGEGGETSEWEETTPEPDGEREED